MSETLGFSDMFGLEILDLQFISLEHSWPFINIEWINVITSYLNLQAWGKPEFNQKLR
jgi:hypothetical protein